MSAFSMVGWTLPQLISGWMVHGQLAALATTRRGARRKRANLIVPDTASNFRAPGWARLGAVMNMRGIPWYPGS